MAVNDPNIAGGDFGASLANTARETGQNAINQFNPQDIAGTQRAGFTGLLGSQLGAGPQNAQDYASRYAQTIAQNPSYTSLYNTANQQFNVPELTQQAAYLQGQVAAQPSQQYALARGFDYSAPQVENAINTSLRFLNPQSQLATQQAQAAQNLAQQYVNYGMQQTALNLQPIQQYGQLLAQSQAAQSTGFNIAAQNELQGLVSKMNAGIQLSNQEFDRANQLLAQQNAYQQALVGQQYKTIGPGQALVSTGAIPGTTAGAYSPFLSGLVGTSTQIR